MNMNTSEISKSIGVTRRYATYLVKGERRPSPDVAEKLEKLTGRHRLHWLYPDQYDESGLPLPHPDQPQDGAA
jgi:plasmid maintenance system antidote protein VapI